ncbi:MAG: cobalamin-dependent protein [Deltaproteobacteria bacterium]|nr:cobalamin-dependent protein [Deltaproteobacteria bacterium]
MIDDKMEHIRQAVVEGGYEVIGDMCQNALDEGIPPKDILMHGLSEGMREMAGIYGKKGMYLDKVLWSTAAFHFGNSIVAQAMTQKKTYKGRIVLGVPDGPWTIGPEIVAAVLDAYGFEVINAGSDVSPDHIAKIARDVDADIVALGLYLSYRVSLLKDVHNKLFEYGIRHKIRTIVSGPSTNNAVAVEVGADAYCADASEIAETAQRFIIELKNAMSSKERVLASMAIKEPDRVPLVPFAMTFCARQAGIPFSEYCNGGRKLAEAEVFTARKFGWDAVIASSDVGVYAEAVGAKVEIPHDDVPRLVGPAIRWDHAAEDFKKLKDPKIYTTRGRLARFMESVKYMKEMVGDNLAVVGWTEGALQGSMLLFGADPKAIFIMKQDPELLKDILGWYNEFAFECARIMVGYGADIIGSGESVSYYLSPETFEEFVLPFEKDLYGRINRELGAKVLIHCCGYVPQCIKFAPEVNQYGAIQFDYQVPLGWAKKLIGDRITIMGNLDCNRILHLSTPDLVQESCKIAINAAANGGGFWLSGGCEIPRDMPDDNMHAMLRSCRQYGMYPLH